MAVGIFFVLVVGMLCVAEVKLPPLEGTAPENAVIPLGMDASC